MYSPGFANQPQKFLKKLKNKNLVKEILHVIEQLLTDPLLGKKLHPPFDGQYSIRHYPYRILYEFDSNKKVLYVLKIEHRSTVYRF